jgi:uncharacterized protein YjdB
MRFSLYVATVIVIAVGVACTRTPTPTSPTVTAAPKQSALAQVISVQLTPTIDAMRLGETVSFSIHLELGEGVPPSFGPFPIWSSTNPATIMIDASGRATAIAKGEATIEVTTHGQRISRQIRVQP